MRLPKIPKGLAARIRKAESKLAQQKKVNDRKKEIMAMRKKLDEITEVWSMEKLISSYDKILKGEVAGRVVIDVNQ